MKLFYYKIVFFSILLSVLASCKKFLEVDLPQSRIVSETVFKSDATATSAMVGVYHQMMYNDGFAAGSLTSITLNAGLSSDELVNHVVQGDGVFFYQNTLNSQLIATYNIWSSAYEAIYAANSILAGISKSSTLSSGVKMQLEGEAKFIRAFSHFYLVNLYGDIPLITTTDYNVNRLSVRTPSSQVYDQIIKDLTDAKQLLNTNYITVEKVRPNKTSAMALLARVYLYSGAWEAAETESSFVLSDSRFSLDSDLDKVFLANSNEAIWQLIEPFAKTYTKEGVHFILTTNPIFLTPASLDVDLVNSFDTTDQRRKKWLGNFNNGTYYYPFKYKNRTGGTTTVEYSMVLRLAEQYLIRAEARAQQDKLSGSNSAASDVNTIRTRAGLPNTTAVTKSDMLFAIEEERRRELFAEWGHRWFDLKRTGRANTVLSKKPNWDATDVLYPIPEKELLSDPNLKPQNPGY